MVWFSVLPGEFLGSLEADWRARGSPMFLRTRLASSPTAHVELVQFPRDVCVPVVWGAWSAVLDVSGSSQVWVMVWGYLCGHPRAAKCGAAVFGFRILAVAMQIAADEQFVGA